MSSNRGRDLEKDWARMLGKVERWANPTIASGAVFGDEDVRSDHYLSQCKSTSTSPNFNIKHKDWTQLHAAAISERTSDGRDYKVGLFVSENSNGEIAVTLTEEDFLAMVDTIRTLKNDLAMLSNVIGVVDNQYSSVEEACEDLEISEDDFRSIYEKHIT